MKLTFTITTFFIFSSTFSQTLSERMQAVYDRNHLVGLSVCVIQKGKIDQEVYLGKRDLDRNLPVNENTVFRVASVSKMFTVTALMQLYDQGLFRMDDDVSRYLGFQLRNPNFPDVPITFSMLMSHTSGLRDGEGYGNFLMASYNQKPFPVLSTVVSPGGLYYTGDMWSKTESSGKGYFTYANINFGILGTLVERLSGERFDKYCINHIFNPLKISASFDIRDIPDINDLGVIYRKENGKWVPQNDQWKGIRPPSRDLSEYETGSNAVLFAPQGGLRISARDLSKFLVLHQNNGKLDGVRLLSDTAAKLMHRVVWEFNGENGASENYFFTRYAHGCMRTNRLVPGVELVGHSGDAYGLLSGLYYSETGDFGFVFITNGGEWTPGRYSGWQTVEEEVAGECIKYIHDHPAQN